MMTLLVGPEGTVRCMYAEVIDLAAIGSVRITRASHVDPDGTGRWWADITPSGGPVLGPFGRRSDALAAEWRWLEENITAVAFVEVAALSKPSCEDPSIHHYTQAVDTAADKKE